MPAMSALRRVDLGRLDAEQEQEQQMREYFVDVGSVDEIRSGKFLVVGRKGSGKTSIFRHLSAAGGGRVVQMDLDKYVFQAHRRLIDTGVSPAFAYTESWRAAIVVAAFAAVVKDLGFFRRHKGMRIIRKIGAGPNGGPLRSIVEWISRVQGVKLPSVVGVFDLGGMQLSSVSEEMQRSTSKHIDDLTDLLDSKIRNGEVTVLIDRLDDAWDGDRESLRLITGAVRAARDFAIRYRGTRSGSAPVVVFLRTDLWAKCEFNDKNKMPADTVTLEWTDEELTRVVSLRVAKSAKLPEGEAWGAIFAADRMRQGVTPLNYMLKRTLGRPRDMLAFTHFARDAAIEKSHALIEKEDVYEAERRYSRHIVEELRDEIREHVSDFESVLNALRALKVRTFKRDAWLTAARRSGMDDAEAESALGLLFESGAVGVLQPGGSRGGSGTIYHYQGRLVQIDAPAVQLQVHPALTKELGLTERYRERGPLAQA